MVARTNSRSFWLLFGVLLALHTSFLEAQTERVIVVDPLDDGAADLGCTLREAISVANANVAEALGCRSNSSGTGFPIRYTLEVPAMTYTLASGVSEDANRFGDLDIASALVINGMGVGKTIIDGDFRDRVIHVTRGFSLVLRDMTIQHGQDSGIFNERGRLEIHNVMVRRNEAREGGGIRSVLGDLILAEGTVVSDNEAIINGGGLFVSGTVRLHQATVSDNLAGRAGGIYSDAELVMDQSRVTGNVARQLAGGLWVLPPSAEILHSEISANQAASDGGGLFINPSAAVGILGSTIFNNEAGGAGGGIRRASEHPATLNVANSTIAANSAGDRGGGFSGGGAFFTHATIVGNHAARGGGGFAGEDNNLRLKSTLVASNTGDREGSGDCFGVFSSGGSNLIRAADDCLGFAEPGVPNGQGDFLGTAAAPVEPLLEDISMLPTIVEPGAGSFALDAIASDQCVFLSTPANPAFADGAPVDVDQRGEPRDGLCDIGAVERLVLFADGFDLD